MKNLTGKMLMIAAALTVTTGIASAADSMKADIPFAFRMGHTVMPAGTYFVDTNHLSGGTAYVVVADVHRNHSALATPQSAIYRASWSAPKLVFDCAAGRCALTQLWSAGEAHQFARPKLGRDELSSRMEVRLERVAD